MCLLALSVFLPLPTLRNRHGFLEECHFTIAYSPVPDETVPTGIGGVLATVHEITDKVIADRRGMLLRDLGTELIAAKSAEDVCANAAKALAAYDKEMPCALLYLVEGERQPLRGPAVSRPFRLSRVVVPRFLSRHFKKSFIETSWIVMREQQAHGKLKVVNPFEGRFQERYVESG